MPKSILIADDSDTIRKITRLFLESQIDLEVCGEAVDGEGPEPVRRPDAVFEEAAATERHTHVSHVAEVLAAGLAQAVRDRFGNAHR